MNWPSLSAAGHRTGVEWSGVECGCLFVGGRAGRRGGLGVKKGYMRSGVLLFLVSCFGQLRLDRSSSNVYPVRPSWFEYGLISIHSQQHTSVFGITLPLLWYSVLEEFDIT